MRSLHSKPIKRPPPFSIRFTPEERDQVEQAAGGMPLASYIKSVVLSDNAPVYRKRRKPPVVDQKLLAEILARLGGSRTASNLNQIAKHLNQGTLIVDPDLEVDLHRAIAEMAWMRASLMRALGIKL
ncbi:hypothetical protein [Cohaesibacter gelatinilyticus]|uniref:Mobilisation protein (MobC) n=1 Tax=Cohaesibacter gelatinilyticus TaxID=372072 RepID=A0A285NEL7_9HYPH|nr:hypothetical protein [Cohaesibacter gelatinilyticus]SNZ07407.1 hypothetical protein SAMN06265368_0926 [Cohaesibacter gelatinilyticus]